MGFEFLRYVDMKGRMETIVTQLIVFSIFPHFSGRIHL